MFERFTAAARRAVVLAEERARILRHGLVGPEHLLCGLIDYGDGVAAHVLAEAGITTDVVAARITMPPRPEPPTGHIPFSSSAKRVLDKRALREALQLGHNKIGTEHVLLAVLRESLDHGGDLPERLGLDLELTRQATLRRIVAESEQRHAVDAIERLINAGTSPALSYRFAVTTPGLRPGDRVLVTTPDKVSTRRIAELREELQGRFPGVEFTVATGISGLAVQRGETPAEDSS